MATACNGTTVEINNTDAEGRLVLADAIAWASQRHPQAQIMLQCHLFLHARALAFLQVIAKTGTGPDSLQVQDFAAERVRLGQLAHPLFRLFLATKNAVQRPELLRRDLVRAHIRKGKTLLLVTHHIHEIPPEVKRVVLLKQGKILQDGEKRSVLTDANLSVLFDCPVALAQANGWYQALPGRSTPH